MTDLSQKHWLKYLNMYCMYVRWQRDWWFGCMWPSAQLQHWCLQRMKPKPLSGKQLTSQLVNKILFPHTTGAVLMFALGGKKKKVGSSKSVTERIISSVRNMCFMNFSICFEFAVEFAGGLGSASALCVWNSLKKTIHKISRLITSGCQTAVLAAAALSRWSAVSGVSYRIGGNVKLVNG